MSERVGISQWIERSYCILSSHRPSQLGWRAFYHLQRRLFPLLPKSAYLVAEGADFNLRGNSPMDAVLGRQLSLRVADGELTARVEWLLSGEFCFLNDSRALGPATEIDLGDVAPVSHLWRFHVHYQEYLLDLLAAGQQGHASAREHIWPIVETWIHSHPLTRPGALSDAWHPYCLSRRIPVWLLLDHAGAIPADVVNTFRRSLESQTRFLERHLEWDLRGNHLFENLRALALAGAYWDGADADRRLDRVLRHADRQLQEQILASGEHFECSPMYHAHMLWAVLDLRDVTLELRPEFSRRCADVASHMSRQLQRILHPDGQIPLFSDATITGTPDPRVLIDATQQTDSTLVERHSAIVSAETGHYWTWRDGGDFLVFDHGPVGADELPAHAHCDLLTIEASVGGHRMIVDSGVFDYDDSEMRRYCRSTAAHNVLQVDRIEQCDLWSRFRMGRRGRPIDHVAGAEGDFQWAAATHNAYARWGVSRIGRWIACRRGGPWIIADWAVGRGEHDLTDRIHLSPEITVSQNDARSFNLACGEYRLTLSCPSLGMLSIGSGWYCPAFGVRHEVPVIQCAQRTALPAMMVWVLSWQQNSGAVSVEADADGHSTVIWRDGNEHRVFSPMALVRQ